MLCGAFGEEGLLELGNQGISLYRMKKPCLRPKLAFLQQTNTLYDSV